jgi:hypothetical protein
MAWRGMHVTPEFKRQREEDLEFKDRLGYIEN